MYKTSGSCFTWVGFRGYAGGLDARCVMEDSDLASTASEDIGATAEGDAAGRGMREGGYLSCGR